MLVISRKKNQEVVIADSIVVKILRVGTDKACIGVTAPPDVSVHRREIYERIHAQTTNPPERTGG